jgi:gamma-glutamyl hercynylcysteine S-oxide synthase
MQLETCDRAVSADVLSAWVRDARARTLWLVEDLDDRQLIGPKLPTVNPLLWEIAHATWFQERWVLQHAAGKPAIEAQGPRLFDSISIDHDVRWDLPLPTRAATFQYLKNVRDAVLEVLDQGPLTESLIYFVKLSVFHEDMHTEAFTYTRQTLAYPAPNSDNAGCATDSAGAPTSDSTNGRAVANDVRIAGGQLLLGAAPQAAFVFDNEKWEHPVSVAPFALSTTAVTQAQFAEFVDDGGYQREQFWCSAGWQWRCRAEALHPIYWRHEGVWLRRHFDQWRPLEPQLPVSHVNWYEADAYCRWAGRRLPSEAEWELAAGGLADKRHYPWGHDAPCAAHANLDWQRMGPADTREYAAGDSAEGCRQLIGNVWEWTDTTFAPYPGFAPDPYKEYSQPCFGESKVLRGGCWATRSRLIRNTWRNLFTPERRDVFAGFRTCAAGA